MMMMEEKDGHGVGKFVKNIFLGENEGRWRWWEEDERLDFFFLALNQFDSCWEWRLRFCSRSWWILG